MKAKTKNQTLQVGNGMADRSSAKETGGFTYEFDPSAQEEDTHDEYEFDQAGPENLDEDEFDQRVVPTYWNPNADW